MNIMKKRNIFLGLVLMLGLTGCYDLDKMPEGGIVYDDSFLQVRGK